MAQMLNQVVDYLFSVTHKSTQSRWGALKMPYLLGSNGGLRPCHVLRDESRFTWNVTFYVKLLRVREA